MFPNLSQELDKEVGLIFILGMGRERKEKQKGEPPFLA